MLHWFKLPSQDLSKLMIKEKMTLVEKGILLSCLIACWESENKGRSGKSTSQLATEIGCEAEDINQLFVKIGPDWLSEEFSMETFELTVISQYLIDQKQKADEEIAQKNRETKQAKRDREVSESTLKKLMIDERAEKEPITIGYLKVEDRSTHFYQGWLPTARFNSSGQVYYVTQDLIKCLEAEFPGTDINSSILAIHSWLSKNTTKRKTYAKIPEFIRFWLKNTKGQAANAVPAIDFDSIQKQLDEMLG